MHNIKINEHQRTWNFSRKKLRKFANSKKIKGRSDAKSEKQLKDIIRKAGYDESHIIIFYEFDDDLPFEFSGMYVLERLDEEVVFEGNRVEIYDERKKTGSSIVLRDLDEFPFTYKEIINIMKYHPHYEEMTDLAGDYQFFAGFRKVKKGFYEAVFDS
jgi:hypothetical protein